MKTETIHFSHGASFDLSIRLISAVFGITGVISIFTGGGLAIVVGVIILSCALYAVTTSSGVIIDREKKLFREYVSYYGIKTGKWVDIHKYPDLVILKNRGASAPGRKKNRIPNGVSVYTLYLMTRSHRNRVMLETFPDPESANTLATRLAGEFRLHIRKYNPQKRTGYNS